MNKNLIYMVAFLPFLAYGNMNFFSADDENPIDIEASESLKIDQNNKIISAFGRPKVTSETGILESDELFAYYEEIGDELNIWRIDAKGNLIATTQTAVLAGQYGVYDARQELIVVTGDPVKAITETFEVQAFRQMEYYAIENKVIARGNVHIEGPEGKGKAEVIEVFLKKNNTEASQNDQDSVNEEFAASEIDEIRAYQNVEIEDEDTFVSGDKAIWSPTAEAIVIFGNVSVIQKKNKNHLNGCQAKVNLKTNVTYLESQGCTEDMSVTGQFQSSQ